MPRWQRLALHLFILAYVGMTLDAFSYTMLRRWSGLFPWPIVRYLYAMMAPYQGIRPVNTALVAEGMRDDGQWDVIDLRPYYPSYSLGQMNVRQELLFIKWSGAYWQMPDLRERRYRELAQMLQSREAGEGRNYSKVRLSWDEWPPSPEGFSAKRPQGTRTFITEVP